MHLASEELKLQCRWRFCNFCF